MLRTVVIFTDLVVRNGTSFELHHFSQEIPGQVWRGFTSGRMVLVDLAMERLKMFKGVSPEGLGSGRDSLMCAIFSRVALTVSCVPYSFEWLSKLLPNW